MCPAYVCAVYSDWAWKDVLWFRAQAIQSFGILDISWLYMNGCCARHEFDLARRFWTASLEMCGKKALEPAKRTAAQFEGKYYISHNTQSRTWIESSNNYCKWDVLKRINFWQNKVTSPTTLMSCVSLQIFSFTLLTKLVFTLVDVAVSSIAEEMLLSVYI